MKLNAKILIVMCLLFGTMKMGMSQEDNSVRTVKTSEGEFIIHLVEKGQTLYAISKKYAVSVEDIQAVNPDLENFGIRIGQTLRIPVKKISKKDKKKADVVLSGDTIYHEVLKKETLYGLIQRYQISEEELIRFNPEIINGLKIGMVVRIPFTPEGDSASTEVDFQQPLADSLLLHEVQPKETLFALSKKYEVSIDSIQMVNDGLQGGLQVGSTIRIPIENPAFQKDKDDLEVVENVRTPLIIGDTLKIVVFLPFCTDKNLSALEENESADLYVLSRISLEFMRGFNMAMDSLKKQGIHVHVDYFDTQNDTNQCKLLIANENLKSYHLIVGPLYQVNFKLFASYARKAQIPIVSPVRVSSRLLLNNRYVIKSHASSPSQIIYMANFMGENHKDSNLIIISGGGQSDKRYADIFQKYLNNKVNDSIAIHRVWQPSVGNFQPHIKKGEHNFVALISSDEAFVSSALSAFYSLEDEETNISVFGIDSWQKFGSIGFDYLMKFDVTYPVQQFVNYDDVDMKNFISAYRTTYFAEPSKHVFSAFDIGIYFGEALVESGGDWESYISNNKSQGFSLRFDFVKIAEESGFENQGGYVLQYDDYELVLRP